VFLTIYIHAVDSQSTIWLISPVSGICPVPCRTGLFSERRPSYDLSIRVEALFWGFIFFWDIISIVPQAPVFYLLFLFPSMLVLWFLQNSLFHPTILFPVCKCCSFLLLLLLGSVLSRHWMCFGKRFFCAYKFCNEPLLPLKATLPQAEKWLFRLQPCLTSFFQNWFFSGSHVSNPIMERAARPPTKPTTGSLVVL